MLQLGFSNVIALRLWTGLLLVLMLVALVPAREVSAQTAAETWRTLRGSGVVVLMRHAEAPGGPGIPSAGDPQHFRLDDCSTQRNLDAKGRAQARRAGERLANEGVAFTKVYSSQWCRCLETVRLALGRDAESLPALNNFFDDRSRAPAQLAELKRFISTLAATERVLMVTHGVVVSGLVGVSPATGEMVVLKLDGRGGYALAGRIQPD